MLTFIAMRVSTDCARLQGMGRLALPSIAPGGDWQE
jgi:hypothetical protein